MTQFHGPSLPFGWAQEKSSAYAGLTDGFNRLGFYHGAAGVTPFNPGAAASVDAGDLLTAERYGQRIATLTHAYTPPA